MASHVVVIATDLRRTTVKVNPGTYLSDVLQEACKKLSLDSDKFLLKHKQKQVDLSVPFRTSGLIAGAKLELVLKSKTPSAVQIALQIPQPEAKEIPGGRLIKKFPSDLSIWQVLRQFESGEASAGKNINITARGVAQTVDTNNSGAGQLYYETPVLNIMGRELGSFADFQKTLSQLGHNSGNVLIRLTFRRTEQTLYEAMEQIGVFFKEEAKKKEEEKETPSAESTLPEVNNSDPQSRLQPVNVFLAPTNSTPAAALLPAEDSDFTPTVAHAQLHQQRLLESSRNKRLLSDREIEEKEAAEQAKIDAVKSVLIKVRFPDNTSSDWEIGPSDTGAFLYQAVRHVMASNEHSFHLVIPGSKTVIKDDDTPKHNLIRAYKLSGRVLVSLVWNDGVPADVRKRPFLKSNFAQQGQEIKVPEIPTAEDDKDGPSVAPKVQQAPTNREGGEGSGKKMPKWFKLGKK
ncbi:TUG ubiquitin-like domain-containing protein [Trichoderma breve]|uniref:TUG ubiquitin-like domain-containing protein n=1 Tax=Trichoderma breve TaxID=2034170 RepID=A0A9W9E5Z3_9HYPO|nr:TUG ubiquitin-like domain-containing protein [Trichoderma breve]KAJ4860313.1 TUG ubiquitin-like domain-containing protein [Trichoderma breve]